jgi:hypothetical protein
MSNSLLLVLGAMLLLTLFTLSANGIMANSELASSQSEFNLTAVSVGESIIEEAKAKAFDQATVMGDSGHTLLTAMADPASLGAEGASELTVSSSSAPDVNVPDAGFLSPRTYNDIDDYNNYVRVVSTARTSDLRVEVGVQYASPTCPDSIQTTRTFCKLMTVKVYQNFPAGTTVPDTLEPVVLSYAFIY